MVIHYIWIGLCGLVTFGGFLWAIAMLFALLVPKKHPNDHLVIWKVILWTLVTSLTTGCFLFFNTSTFIFLFFLLALAIPLNMLLNYLNFRAVKTPDVFDYTPVRIALVDQGQLGCDWIQHAVHYIAIDKDGLVFFPESQYPKHKYYLTDVEFYPNIKTTRTVHSNAGKIVAGAAVAGTPGALIGASMPRKVNIKRREKRGFAYVTLLTPDFKTPIHVQFKLMTSEYVAIRNLFVTTPTQLQFRREHVSLSAIEAQMKLNNDLNTEDTVSKNPDVKPDDQVDHNQNQLDDTRKPSKPTS